MGRIAFKSVFLASPIAFFGSPAIASLSPLMADATSVSVKLEGDLSIPENHRSYVVVDVPVYMRPEVTKPFQNLIVAEELRPPVMQSGQLKWNSSAPAGPDVETAGYLSSSQSNAEQYGLLDAVIEDHSRRVEFLKQRLEAIRFRGGDLRAISDLEVRLKRAQAARSVALARKDINRLAVAVGASARDNARVVAIVSTHLPVVESYRKSTRRHIVGTAHCKPSASYFSGNTFHAHEPARSSTKHLGSATLLLASAKRSLANARSQLAHIPDAVPNAFDRHGAAVAGLLRWPGSEAWSLSAQRT